MTQFLYFFEELASGHECEFAQFVMRKDVQVVHDGLDEFLTGIGVAVLGDRQLDEVTFAPIELIAVEVVELATLEAFAVPDLEHGMVAE